MIYLVMIHLALGVAIVFLDMTNPLAIAAAGYAVAIYLDLTSEGA